MRTASLPFCLVAAAVFCLVAAAVLALAAGCGAAQAPADPAPSDDAGAAGEDEYVPLHAEFVVFIMARCPHCADLMRELVPLVQELGDSAHLAIGYVGSVDALGQPVLPEGDPEAAAAAVQVCAALAAEGNEHLEFLRCQYEGDDWRRSPGGWERCADRAGLDAGEIEACLEDGTGREGVELAVAAAAASGVEAAPTVLLDGRPYVGERSRRSLLTHFCHLAGEVETRPARCDQVSPPAELGAVLVVDARCAEDDLCDVGREVAFLQMLMPTLDIVELDYASDEGRALYDAVRTAGGPRDVPLLVFDEGLADRSGVLAQLEEYLLVFGDGYLMPLGEGWDPTAEICDNGADDDGDGDADCDDEGCAGALVCRPETAGRLDLFIMSQCPFSTAMIDSVDRFLAHFDRDRDQVDLHLQFVGSVGANGALSSMHGPEELAEDRRMACAQELYPDRYRFMRYVRCRAADYRSGDWERCVPDGMSARRLRRCAEGERGEQLLRASFDLAERLEIYGSPSWVLNNKLPMEGRTAPAIHEAFCAANGGTPGCASAPEAAAGEVGSVSDKCLE